MRRVAKISIVVVVVVGIYFTLPFFFGLFLQKKVTQFLQNENKTLGQVFNVEFQLNNYQRGWFHSTGEFQLSRTDQGQTTILEKFPIRIQHGPAFFERNHFVTGFGLITAEPISFGSLLPYVGSLHEHLDFHGEHGVLSFTPKDTAERPFTAGSLQLFMSNNLDATQFRFRLVGNQLRYQDPNQPVTISMQQLVSDVNAEFLGDQHWGLVLSLNADQDRVHAGDQITFSADRLALNNVHMDTKTMTEWVTEASKLKEKSDETKSIPPAALIALAQSLVTDVVDADTNVQFKNWVLKAPSGEVQGDYTVGFPALTPKHDYFDVVAHNVTSLRITVPHWVQASAETDSPKGGSAIDLSGLVYHTNTNTVFSQQSTLSLNTIALRSTQSGVPDFMNATGFLYLGNVNGDHNQISQNMSWQLEKLCVFSDCYKKINLSLKLLDLKFDAFRDVAARVREFVQGGEHAAGSDPAARFESVAMAYQQLIQPQTRVFFSAGVITPDGPVGSIGKVWWDATNAVPAYSNAHYQLKLSFPAKSVDDYLRTHQPQQPTAAPNNSAAPTPEQKMATFLSESIQQGYLKKVGNDYTAELQGYGNKATINGVNIQ